MKCFVCEKFVEQHLLQTSSLFSVSIQYDNLKLKKKVDNMRISVNFSKKFFKEDGKENFDLEKIKSV
jgi:hypothetical protein